MRILAIDPGTTESGWCQYVDGAIDGSGVCQNIDVLEKLRPFDAFQCGHRSILAVESVSSYGMPVGKEVFRTVWWCGRIAERWVSMTGNLPIEVYRKDVKLHLCGSLRAKDGNIRQALIDKLGAQGNKANPGATYGVKSHAWAALAVAVYVAETMRGDP